ncbi:MAG: hypothetical protein QOF11_2693 [Chloroflexota bacterium]|nr:hypothetical protein [Chloroflexota bacterium]
MSKKGVSLKKSMAREARQGRGKCGICGLPALWRSWVKIGTDDQFLWLCEPHRKELAPRDYEKPRARDQTSGDPA